MLLGRFAVEVVATPPPGLGLAGLAACSSDPHRRRRGRGWVGRELAARLGPRALLVDEPPPEAEAVIVLAGLGGDGAADAAGRAVRRVFRAARTVAGAFTRRGGVFVTVHDSGGDFGRSGGDRAWLAGIAGIAKTAAQEWPRASVKTIDLAGGGRPAAALAAAIVAELLEGGSELEVGLSAAGGRVTLATRAAGRRRGDRPPRPSASAPWSWRRAAVAGSPRRAWSRWRVARRGRFILLGSTPLLEEPPGLEGLRDEASLTRALAEAARRDGEAPAPARLGTHARAILAAREVRATLEALRDAGAECRYEAVDIRDGAGAGAGAGRGARGLRPDHGAGPRRRPDCRQADRRQDRRAVRTGARDQGRRPAGAARRHGRRPPAARSPCSPR